MSPPAPGVRLHAAHVQEVRQDGDRLPRVRQREAAEVDRAGQRDVPPAEGRADSQLPQRVAA